jgi:hypothetical protein
VGIALGLRRLVGWQRERARSSVVGIRSSGLSSVFGAVSAFQPADELVGDLFRGQGDHWLRVTAIKCGNG